MIFQVYSKRVSLSRWGKLAKKYYFLISLKQSLINSEEIVYFYQYLKHHKEVFPRVLLLFCWGF